MKISMLKVLQLYLYGVAEITKDTEFEQGAENYKYVKGQRVQITPAILYMVVTGKIPQANIKPILRQIHQVEDKEWREFAKIAVGDGNVPVNARVIREGVAETYTVSIELSEGHAISVNAKFDVCLIEKLQPHGGLPPVHTALALLYGTTAALYLWAYDKKLDVNRLINSGAAFGQSPWAADDYAKPNDNQDA